MLKSEEIRNRKAYHLSFIWNKKLSFFVHFYVFRVEQRVVESMCIIIMPILPKLLLIIRILAVAE